MNYFYKCALTAAFSIAALCVNAQDLVHKIPADALAVITVKGKNLTDLMPVKEFNNSFIGKKILNKLATSSKGTINTVEDLGFDLSANFYYYIQTNDSLTYHCVLAPVKNAALIDQLYNETKNQFTTNGKVRSQLSGDSNVVTLWNDKMLLFVIGQGRDSYVKRPEVRQRYGLPSVTDDLTSTIDTTNDVVVTAEPVAENAPLMDIAEATYTPAQEIKKHPVKKKSGYSKKKSSRAKSKKSYKPKKRYKAKKPVEQYPEEMTDTTNTAYAYGADADTTTTTAPFTIVPTPEDSLKKVIAAHASPLMANAIFNKTDGPSILDNKDFTKNAEQNAEISLWISGAEKLMNTYIPPSILKGFNFLNGYGSASINLHLEKQAIRMSTSLTLSNEVADAFRKINKRKLNKEFLKYVNEDKMIGYAGYAMDTKAYLQEYPKLMTRMYGAYTDELSMATDLFSLLLDEEAVSKVFKGDGLIVFNGLTQKEVTYKTNEYNEENFETKEVTKTKKESIPDFLFMTSTEDTRLLNKLIAYGTKKEIVKDHQGYYELTIPKSPVAFYFVIKNGIIFLGTSSSEIEEIVSNKYQSHVSSAHKKLLTGNNFAGYFSPKKLVGKIPEEEAGNTVKLKQTNDLLNALGDIYIKSGPISGNTISGEVSMGIPANQPNALKYLFSILEDFKK